MNCGYLVPTKEGLALYFPDDVVGVAHVAHHYDKDEPLTLFAPRELSENEREQLGNHLYNLIHDAEYRIRARRFLQQISYQSATDWLLGRVSFILQVFGIGGILFCLISGRYRADDIVTGIYWVIALPFCKAVGALLMSQHAQETIAGLHRLYHSPIAINTVILKQLTTLSQIIETQGYEAALQEVRDLGLKELILFYKRCCQYPRWVAKAPNVCGVIRA